MKYGIKTDLHIHSVFSDGKNPPQEIVEWAIEKGLETLGFSDHSYTGFDKSYCMGEDELPEYKSCIYNLKEEYSDKIEVLCGIEQDLFSTTSTDGLDYVIASVHYIKPGERYIPIDESSEILKNAAKEYFDGDIYALAEMYYENVAALAEMKNASIIGHFDLITKFNEREFLFDKKNKRYVSAWKNASDRLLDCNIPFEINTGAISRGYRTQPYPDDEIYNYLKERGARFILSSDSHKKETLLFGFEALADKIRVKY